MFTPFLITLICELLKQKQYQRCSPHESLHQFSDVLGSVDELWSYKWWLCPGVFPFNLNHDYSHSLWLQSWPLTSGLSLPISPLSLQHSKLMPTPHRGPLLENSSPWKTLPTRSLHVSILTVTRVKISSFIREEKPSLTFLYGKTPLPDSPYDHTLFQFLYRSRC